MREEVRWWKESLGGWPWRTRAPVLPTAVGKGPRGSTERTTKGKQSDGGLSHGGGKQGKSRGDWEYRGNEVSRQPLERALRSGGLDERWLKVVWFCRRSPLLTPAPVTRVFSRQFFLVEDPWGIQFSLVPSYSYDCVLQSVLGSLGKLGCWLFRRATPMRRACGVAPFPCPILSHTS